MKLKICRDSLIDDMFCNEANTNCIPLPDNCLWSEEAKLRYQVAFHTPEVKKNYIPLPDNCLWSEEAKLRYQEASHIPEVKKIWHRKKTWFTQCTQVQSLIDQWLMLCDWQEINLYWGGHLSQSENTWVKNNKKWYDKDCKNLLREVNSRKMHLTKMFSTIHCEYNIIVNLRTIKDWLNVKGESTKTILQIC